MASKGQKFQKVSPTIKSEILGKYLSGNFSYSQLGAEYEVSYKTIETWVRKAKKGIDITTDHKKGNSGRKKSKDLTKEDYKERYEILKKYLAFLEARQGKK